MDDGNHDGTAERGGDGHRDCGSLYITAQEDDISHCPGEEFTQRLRHDRTPTSSPASKIQRFVLTVCTTTFQIVFF